MVKLLSFAVIGNAFAFVSRFTLHSLAERYVIAIPSVVCRL